jgi:homoserine kinase
MTLHGPLRVRVPGSTSNLGPGFDLLGLALSLYLEARLEWLAAEPDPTPGAYAGDGPDLLRAAFDLAAGRLGVTPDVRLRCESEIPVGRGLGSSGAAVAAGLLLANARAEAPVQREELLRWGIELEGHPDNVAASLFGGCTLCHPSPTGAEPGEAAPVLLRQPVHPSIGFALAWPARPLATAEARRALPAEVPFADAVENPRRLALLLEGLRSGTPELLRLGGEERLHVRHRLELVPGAADALAAARAAGAWLATISGAGSGLVALAPHALAAQVAHALEGPLVAASGGGGSRVAKPVTEPPAVQDA